MRTGKQLLQSLEKGMAVRKKWVTHLKPADIAGAAKTTRTVRCVVRESKTCLQYSHQVCIPLPTFHVAFGSYSWQPFFCYNRLWRLAWSTP